MNSITPIKAVPWHLIGQLARDGHPVVELAKQFGLSPERIQSRLDIALAPANKVRSNLEIKTASNQVRADLVTALQRLTSQLAAKENINHSDIPALAKLTESAARLFAWPSAKAIDVVQIREALNATPVVNLDLIRTPPEQLRNHRAIIDENDA